MRKFFRLASRGVYISNHEGSRNIKTNVDWEDPDWKENNDLTGATDITSRTCEIKIYANHLLLGKVLSTKNWRWRVHSKLPNFQLSIWGYRFLGLSPAPIKRTHIFAFSSNSCEVANDMRTNATLLKRDSCHEQLLLWWSIATGDNMFEIMRIFSGDSK